MRTEYIGEILKKFTERFLFFTRTLLTAPTPTNKMFNQTLLHEIRAQFHHVESCPYQGARIFFENAGGSLTLKSVVEINAALSAIPDNQGRDNPASREMMRLIDNGKADMMTFLGAAEGQVWVGESGTECLFRVIRAALLGCADGGQVVGSTLEHPATASAAKQWSARCGKEYIAIPHDPRRGAVGAEDYRRHVSADTRLATIIQTSPVTGIAVDVEAITAAIREVSPQCLVVVDGIQHAPHGDVQVARYAIDAYAVSGYKVFSRHNYGFAWVSPRLSKLPHDRLEDTPAERWELGTRDAAAYATFTAVVDYLEWLGGKLAPNQQPKPATSRRARILAAADAIARHEKHLVKAMLHGVGKQKGLAHMPRVFIIGGADNANREGLVSLAVRDMPSEEVVRRLGENGVRVHTRKRDTYSANILNPLQLQDCVRVSMCHYNSIEEVTHFLKSMRAIIADG